MKVKIAVFAILLTGIALNQVVVGLNGGMPIPSLYSYPPTPYDGRIPITEQTKLVFLADIISHPWGHSSIGDLLIILSAGVAVIIIVQTGVKYLRRVSREEGVEPSLPDPEPEDSK